MFKRIRKSLKTFTGSIVLACILLQLGTVNIWAAEDKSSENKLYYTGNGTAVLPYKCNIEKVHLSSLSGEFINSIYTNKETYIFEKTDGEGKVEYAIKLDGRRLKASDASASYLLNVSLSGSKGEAEVQLGNLPFDAEITFQSKPYFSDAAIISVSREGDTAFHKAAVTADGYISFKSGGGGRYLFKNSGKTVAAEIKHEAKNEEDGGIEEAVNSYKKYAYTGLGNGTEEEPLVLLGDLGHPFHASWICMNTLAGFEGGSFPSEDKYQQNKVMKTMIEYRDAKTGHLNASIYIDGSKWKMTTESSKGPYYLDYILDPDEKQIEESLMNHSLYTGQYAFRREKAVKALATYSKSKDTLLFYLSRTREFAGPLVYRLDVSKYFSPGDQVNAEYVLGCSNGSFYHGTMPSNAQLLLEEPSYSKYNTQAIVDEEGYVSFPIYNGGYFTLTKSGVVRPKVDLNDNMKSGRTKESPAKASKEIQANKQGTDGAKTGKKQIVMEKEKKKEQVTKNKEAIKGVLKENAAKRKTAEKNFSMSTKDSGILAEGYIKAKDLRLDGKVLKDKVSEIQALLKKQEEVKEVYDIKLLNKKGEHYKLSDEEYLDITITLNGDYNMNDENKLSIKYIDENGRAADEVFKASSKLADDGKMHITFHTNHLSTFAVTEELEAKKAELPVITQEYKSEKTAALAESKQETADNRAGFMILLGSVIILGVIVIIADRKRKKQLQQQEV